MKNKYNLYTNSDFSKTIRVYEGQEIPKGFFPGCGFNKNRKSWNSGLTATEDERVKLNTDHCHETRRLNNNYGAWNKNLTKESDERVAYNAQRTVEGIREKYGVDNISQFLCKQPDYHIWNEGLTASSDTRVLLMQQSILAGFENGREVWNKNQTKDTNEILKSVSNQWKYGDLLEKRYQTQLKNGTLGINFMTKPEVQLYEYLIELFGLSDITPQYKSDVFPFKADFYIHSKNLYIDMNAHPTHGSHPFNINNEQDCIILNKLKDLNTRWSNAIIYTWTNLDKRKREIVKQNNLNFIAIYKNDEDIVYAHLKGCEGIFTFQQLSELLKI